MASVTSLSNQNYVSSLYNSSKTISGLASGLDTEGMIEGLTQSYQAKITQLQQKSTKVQWKQEAYQSMISKMYSYSNKYTSYTSSTNLMSQSFWNSAKTSSVSGTYASKVSASGTSTSDVVLNSVTQLATAARYSTAGNFGAVDGQTIKGASVDLSDPLELSTLQGTLSFTYGNKTVSIAFSESDQIELKTKEDGTKETKAEALARVINEKLADETITLSNSSVAASEKIKATANADGSISIGAADANADGTDKAGNSIYLSGASGTVGTVLGLGDFSDTEANKTKTKISNVNGIELTQSANRLERLSGKSMNINLNGTIKKITMPTVSFDYDNGYMIDGEKVSEEEVGKKYAEALNKAIQKEFGNKISVENVGDDDKLQLQFNLKNTGDELLINTDAGSALGIGNVASNYLSTGKTLEDLGFDFSSLTPNKDGKYDFTINGKVIGSYDKDTTLSTIMSDINSKSDVRVSYSKTSRQFVFTSNETGEHTEVDFGPGLASAMFGRQDDVDLSTRAKNLLKDEFPDGLAGQRFSMTVDVGGGKTVAIEFSGAGGTLEQILNRVNEKLNDAAPGLTASFAKDGSLVVKDENNQAVGVTLGDGDGEVAAKLVSALQKQRSITNGAEGYTAGKDAKFTVTVNGTEMEMTRSDNKVEIDGLTINFKGTFTTDEAKGDDPVTFQNDIKGDKVIDTVKEMIAELNVMLSEARTGYATLPAQTSSGASYEPLTDEDSSSMSESAIKSYEEKAKQGLLFADSNLSGFYNNIVSIFNRTGTDRTLMEKMGIGLSYDANGAATVTFDENKMREAMESDFDGVVDLFTRTKESGGTDGIMQSIKTQMDRYGATTGAVKGIMVQQAGTPLASLTLMDNGWQKEIDNYATQIEKWQEKLKSQVDRYTKLFTRLETLTNTMNSQSSALAGLMGG